MNRANHYGSIEFIQQKFYYGEVKKFAFLLLMVLSYLTIFSSRVYAIGYANTPADLILGHPDFTCAGGERDGDNIRGMVLPFSSVFVTGTKLIMPGGNASRVRVYDTIPTTNNPYPDLVLGIADICLHPYAKGMPNDYYSPVNTFFDGTHFLVADNAYHRVMIYSHGIPTSNNTVFDIVIGQPDLTTKTANTGGIGASTLKSVYDVWSNGTKLIISDQGNNRILIWNTFPTTTGQAADVVIGQTDMVTATAGTTAAKLSAPRGLDVYDGKLFVADQNNHRVLIYNSIPTSNGASADIVLGQSLMTTGTANNGGLSASTLNTPTDVNVKDGKIFVGDKANNRILIFNTIPTSNKPNADVVVGQTDFVTNSSGISATKFNFPYSGYSDGTKLYVTDYSNNRVVIFNSIPTSNGAVADLVLGQDDLVSNVRLMQKPATGARFLSPGYLATDTSGLYLADVGDYRVLRYNALPTSDGASADIVIGQPDLTTATSGVTAAKFSSAGKPVIAGSKLIAPANNRVLIFNTIPTTSGPTADVVIGQSLMTTDTSNNGGLSAKSLGYTPAVATDGTKLVVCDYGNNRVLVFNTIPTSNFASADVVIGQPDFVHNTANNGGISATTLQSPYGVTVKNGKLFIADSGNNRVLIYNSIPTTNGASADVVVGQSDFTSNLANRGGSIAANTLNSPFNTSVDGSRLFIADHNNARVLIFNTIPTSNGASADAVVGQTNMTSNIYSTSQSGMYAPRDAAVWSNKLLVADMPNNRITGYPLGPQHTSVTGGGLFNSSAVSVALAADDAKDVMISEDASFTGASWESFATSKSYTVSVGDGVKTLYVKMRDYANYEGTPATVTVTVDTAKPGVVKLTDIGKISNIPDKSPLYYYFTSQTAHIKGTAEAGSTIHFKYDGKDKTVVVGADGKFSVEITNLPRELTEFSYYTQDAAGNKSTSRILKLMVGEKNFPSYLTASTTTPTVTPSPNSTTIPTSSPTQAPTPTLVLYDVQLTDQAGHILKNTTVYINGQKYQTDSQGKLYVQEAVAKSTGVTVEVNGKKYQGNILGNTIVAQLTQATTKKTNYNWLWWLLAILVFLFGYFGYRTSVNRK